MAATTKKRRRSSDGCDVLYGFHPVVEALRAGRRTVDTVMVDRASPSARQARVIALAEQKGAAWQALSPDQIRAVCGSDQHQGVAATVSPLPTDSLEVIVSGSSRDDGACLMVLLDSIVDPNNLGAIVRTAHCAGADALVVPKDRAVGATPGGVQIIRRRPGAHAAVPGDQSGGYHSMAEETGRLGGRPGHGRRPDRFSGGPERSVGLGCGRRGKRTAAAGPAAL